MMNYELNPRLILRVPRFPVNKAGSSLDVMLQDPVFRDALYLASDSVFDELARNDFLFSKCSEKMKHSLAKYKKRICYRPTPFGAFAALAVIPLNGTDNDGIVIAGQSFEAFVVDKEYPASDAKAEDFRVNPFLYNYGADFRVLGKGEKGTFAISELFSSAVLRSLAAGHQIISYEDLVCLLRNNGVSIHEMNAYISELTELQIIIPHQIPRRSFPRPLAPKHKEKPGSFYDSYCTVSASGSLPEGIRQQLNDAIYCLDKLSMSYDPEALTSFKDRFERLFEKREVPLLQALDPELGIDYDGLSTRSSSTENGKVPATICWSSLHELVLGKWTMQPRNGIPEVEIMEKELLELSTPEKNYPPGSCLMFSVLSGKLHLKAAGGASSLNMIGRFTVLDPIVLDLAKDLAQKEMESNPGVVFAELSHLDSPEVASVNKKAIVYDYQIPFFEVPVLSDDFVIGLNDLYISLAGKRLVLRSARLNSQVIPRFSNAYNYQRSTLPIFRFLCDLQHEGLDTNLNFSMARLFPGLPAYPRVSYKGIVLEAASWHLEARDLSLLNKLDAAAQFDAFTLFASHLGLPTEFSYEVHDHLLHINLSSEHDIGLLLKAIPSFGKIILREYYKSQEFLVQDDQGNSYTHECIAFLTNRTASYTPGSIHSLPTHLAAEKYKLFPFDDWLYFKIFLHPVGYADLLVNYVQPFIAENVRKGNISCWFFISYYDEDFHLRVRVRQVPGRETWLLKTYKKLEAKLRQLPNLKRLELATYFKERERYGSIGIRAAEELFRLSSEMVFQDLTQPALMNDQPKYKVFSGLRHLLMVSEVLGFGLSEIEVLSKSFTAQLTKSERIDLDLDYRENMTELSAFLMRYKDKSVQEYLYFRSLLGAFKSLTTDEKMRLVKDLNHMHLNRLYLFDQLVLEVKTYYFLGKIARMLRYKPEYPG